MVTATNPARILVVDDDRRILDMVVLHLEDEGYGTRACSDGAEALEALASESFDLVLCDVRMPALDGITLVRRVKEIDPDLPVILVTGETVFDTAVRAVQHGAFDYIVKPFSMQGLGVAVERGLERRALLVRNRKTHGGPAVPVRAAPPSPPAPVVPPSPVPPGIADLRKSLEDLREDVERRVAALQALLDGLESRAAKAPAPPADPAPDPVRAHPQLTTR